MASVRKKSNLQMELLHNPSKGVPQMEGDEHFETSINAYLASLSGEVRSELFRAPETCLAVFRLLPQLAKFYIMTLLFQSTMIPYSDLNRWINKPSAKTYQGECLRRLRSLDLLKEVKKQIVHPVTKQPATVTFVQLNDVFKVSFKNAIAGLPAGVSPDSNDFNSYKSNNIPSSADKNEVVSIEYLDSWSLDKWERILHFMVGSQSSQANTPSIVVLRLLRYAGLMELDQDRRLKESMEEMTPNYKLETNKELPMSLLKTLSITKHGFQFLLQEINNQIWTLLIQYLLMSETKDKNAVDVLNFIFMLGSLELGQMYPVNMLTDIQKQMLFDLSEFGLIFYKDQDHFYPTRLSTALTSKSTSFKSASTAMDEEIANPSVGTVVIETNFKIYCYTSSPLQIAILNLFVHMKARFPNLVTGVVSRDSIRTALVNGITAEQILNYLESHAHPGMLKLAQEEYTKKHEFQSSIGNTTAIEKLRLEVLPPTVADQIKLWQLEMDRIHPTKGLLYRDFQNDMEFEKLLSFGEENGIIVWKDMDKKKFFVTTEGSQQILEYANRMWHS